LSWHRSAQALAKTLAAVKISKDDVKLIVAELEIDEDTAETKLREANGDVIVALKGLTN
jgi:NACalpha-BTF3-like transcription factor